ncbi:uncharacterized protein LOC133518223 [Cydia pomonella]|uniref:uncharacterized protein LOC133518223 n=1 Tax=Cydia pomonella TaxID=82600 RepID=UPI002ADDB1B1|nr:uncharacterized protein LOC133518223 [Cydia pomonella]
MALLSASVGGLRELITLCEQFATSHGLKYNVKKSEIMVFKAGSNCPTNIPPVCLNGAPLKRVREFKSLGHVLTDDLVDDSDNEKERRALSVRANMIARRFASCSYNVKVTLFRAYCTTFYTCSLWVKYTQRAYNALRVQYNDAFRALLRLPRFCSASDIFAEARLDCFYATMRKRASSAVRRMRASGSVLLAVVADRLDSQFVRHWLSLHCM